MRIAKVNAGHWKDGGSGPGFNKRYEFAGDLVDAGKVAISFLDADGHPFHKTLKTKQIKNLSKNDIKEGYLKEGSSENKADNRASQLVRFRDWPIGTPLFLYLGRNMVYRVGYIKGEYEFDWNGDFHGPESNYNHPHVREVEWADAPELFSRKKLPEDFQGWIKHQQTAIDYDVEPGSDAADFLALAFGIGRSLSGMGEAELRVLR
ncbi:hypothetical protein [Natronobiforma cellulositropha]|uniref:hypothetical protein n=1 Tax=Natronobiforma cellulositropha TaxID=1679076 RepID=UPI0021D5A6A8|nr:hypothetical protein [Natronobiforma cellulositropha]